jgi:hypothetical protein
MTYESYSPPQDATYGPLPLLLQISCGRYGYQLKFAPCGNLLVRMRPVTTRWIVCAL